MWEVRCESVSTPQHSGRTRRTGAERVITISDLMQSYIHGSNMRPPPRLQPSRRRLKHDEILPVLPSCEKMTVSQVEG